MDKNNSPSLANGDGNELLFSKTLTQLMAERQLTLKAVSEMAGVGISTVSDWQSGSAPHNLIAVRKLAKGLGVSLSYLLFAESDNQPSRPSEVFVKENIVEGFFEISIKRLTPKQQ